MNYAVLVSSSLTILAIGSCRIFRPLRRLHDAGSISLANYHANFWFTHTSGAARQYVDVIRGHKTIPMHLRRAALESVLEYPGEMATGIPPVDVVVVEVSSLKQHRIGDYYLNAHKIYGLASESGLSPQAVLNGQTDGLPDDHPLNGLVMEQTTQQDLDDDLVAIREKVGAPVLTVDHLHSLTPAGMVPPERARLTEELRAVSELRGFEFYSTKDLILEHGIEKALLDQNHYRSEFELVVGEKLYPRLLNTAEHAALR